MGDARKNFEKGPVKSPRGSKVSREKGKNQTCRMQGRLEKMVRGGSRNPRKK